MEDFQVTIDWANRNLTSVITGILIAIVLLVIGRWLAKRVSHWTGRWLKRAEVDETAIRFIQALVYIGLLVGVIIAALDAAGVHTTSFTALLASAGLAIGLALKDSLANFASGVMILLFKPYVLNDSVEAGGTSGTVEEVSIFNTILHTPDNVRVIVPNGLITKDTIKNYSFNDTRRVDLVAGISYDDNIGLARSLLMEMMTTHELVLDDPLPTVVVLELADSSVNLAVRAWAKTVDYWQVRCELLEEMKLRFDNAGISMPFPQREVYLHDMGG